MEVIYSDVTISMSEFKKNPAAVLRDAKSKPVPHTHVALDDAIEQGALFCNMLAVSRPR